MKQPNPLLRDYLKPGLRVLFVGINPGLRSAQLGHHFAGHSNRFWKLLYESGLVDIPLTYQDDWRLPEWGLGLTNIISRPSAGIDTLARQEYVDGGKRLLTMIHRYRPKVVALLGVTIYRRAFPDAATDSVHLGIQPKVLAGIRVFVLPNPSGRNAHYSYHVMLSAFRTLEKEAGSQ